ncbi:MAG TPA: TonB-dependent receptor [Gammaproteobacteria bacterium]|nr:TonB-dependent receptor [Gammaproteobacteria bacterium]
MFTRRRSRAVARISLCLSVLIAVPALAQQELEEIVVTARLRSEAYEKAPAAIKAFTAGEIQAAGIDKVHDFIQLTPNMTVVQTQNPGNTFITIRGISQARNSDMPVAVVVDGVLMTNPAAFNQELNDIQQIEVLKGPQGALYGRNAIGGAINIVTKQATDHLDAKIRVGFDDGPGYLAQGAISGPISDKWKYRIALSHSDTDGYLDNTALNQKADPYKDTSGRIRFTWDPSDKVSGDFRYSASHIDTTALYFVINNDYGFGSAATGVHVSGDQYNNPNYTGVPIRVNNPGEGIKNADQVSMKWDIKGAGGTFTSITSYDALDEILTGDAFDFRPPPQSFNVLIGPFIAPTSCAVTFYPCATVPLVDQQRASVTDWNQSQYLNVKTTSQEFRYASDMNGQFNWLAGIYLLDTQRYISTGNMVDTGTGVSRVYRSPRTSDGNPGDFTMANPQWTFLADSQDNFAWAAFGSLTWNFTKEWDATFSARYDSDKRKQTTDTPQSFIPASLSADLISGQQREKTWDAWQPKATVRWRPTDHVTLYGDLSRGFRSGGFNQSGVALAGVAGVKDTFDQQIADTIEVGIKTQLNNNRIQLNAALFDTDLTGAYYFIFLVQSSTQNLGSIDKSHYSGFEFELNALLTDHLNLNFAYATTDSTIKADAEVPTIVGSKIPLVPEYTMNFGVSWTKPLNRKSGTSFVVRADYRRVGKTFWGPGDVTITPLPWDQIPRNPYDVLDLRVGLQGSDWELTFWAKNALDEKYNDEFSYPFVWKAQPQRYGIQYTKSF